MAGFFLALLLASPAFAAEAPVPSAADPAASRFSTTTRVVPRYFRRVLFRFAWGAGEGQLGMVREQEEVLEVKVGEAAPSSTPAPASAPAPAASTARGEAGFRFAREQARASGPGKMVVDGRGNVFIDDPVNRRTLIWDRATRSVRVFASPFPFSRACCFDGVFVYLLLDGGDKVGRVEKTRLQTGAREELEFDQSAGALLYDGMTVDKFGVITLESPRNGKVAVLDPWAKKVAVTEGGVERMVLPLEIEPLLREGEEQEAPPVPPWSVDDPPLALYTGGMTVVSGDQVKVDAAGRVYLRLVKARESVFHREFLQCYDPRGGFLWEAPLDRSENLYAALEKGALVDVDRKGDVYQLVVRETGAELVYWDWGWGK